MQRHTDNRPRVLFMGTQGPFSYTVLKGILEGTIDVVGIVLPGPAPAAPESMNPLTALLPRQYETIATLAQDAHIPTLYIRGFGNEDTLRALQVYGPDFILVACFPYILPTTVRHIPSSSCLNLHPSLLPAYRGPTPLFWQFRNNEQHTGVTLHRMNEVIDGGAIVLQEKCTLADGIHENNANVLLARAGARLFLRAVERWGRLDLREQDEQLASYYPPPSATDLRICTTWSARRAFNFIHGTLGRLPHYPIAIGAEQIAVQAVLSYDPDAILGVPYEIIGREVRIQFSPGVLYAVRIQD